MNYRVLFLILVGFLLSGDSQASDAPAFPLKPAIHGELKQWHKVTLTLDGPPARETDNEPNPFTDYRMSVTFEHESGSPKYQVPGYFAADGNAANASAAKGNKWRAHLSPDKPGKWTYAISFVKGKQVAVSEAGGEAVKPLDGRTGKFMIAPTDKKGRDFRARGRLQYVGKNYLRFPGTGEYFLKAGADSPETLLAYADFDGTRSGKQPGAPRREGEAAPAGLHRYEPHLKDWNSGDPTWKDGKGKGLIGALNYLAGKGVNSISFLSYNAGGDGDNVWPFVARDDKLHYDCSKLDQWGIVFDHATRLGLSVHFKLQETEMDDQRAGPQRKPVVVPEALDGGRLGVERKLYLRELIARFGHALALNWNLGEENTQSADEVRDMARFLRDTDPYDHTIVIHTFPGEQDKVYPPLLGDGSALSGASLQNSWSQAHQRTLKWVTESSKAGKPWVVANDEQGPASLGVPPDPGYQGFDGTARDKPSDAGYDLHDIRKRALWGTLMAGGAGVEYYFGYTLPQNDLGCEDFRSRDKSWDYCRIALDFFRANKIPFWEMSNHDTLIGNATNDNSNYCFARPGRVYLVYLPQGGKVELDLKDARGAFAVAWFNPRAGGALEKGSVEQIKGGGKVSLGQPPADANNDWLIVVRSEVVFPRKNWEEATPESQGVDSTKLAGAVDYLKANAGSDGVRELVIVRNGRLIWKGDNSDKVHGVWSCTKSFTSTCLGLLIEDGKCSLDTRAAKLVPELAEHYPDITLRHFTTMTSGYRAVGDETSGGYKHGPSSTPFRPNPKPLFTPPGSRYAYWDSAINVFGLALTRAAGKPLETLFQRRIAEPIGMNPKQWINLRGTKVSTVGLEKLKQRLPKLQVGMSAAALEEADSAAPQKAATSVDVVVYGGTPGGIAAAIAAAKSGHTVLLAEPTIRIGGMTSNGLSHPDFKSFEALTGAYLELTKRAAAYYTKQYGANSPQMKDSLRGTHAEPKVNLLLFQQMLAEQPRITVKTQWTLVDAKTRGPAGNRWVRAAHFRDAAGKDHVYEGKVFIDASYEGDLIASAQVQYRVGVESRDEYGESSAPKGAPEDGDGQLQGYNFRLCMTQDPANRVPVATPKGYRREDFAGLIELIADGRIKKAFGEGIADSAAIVKAHAPAMPNGKRDINDVSNGVVRLSLPGAQLIWPAGDAATRQRIYEDHVRWNVGLIYFAQNDPSVPEAFRREAATWGWCRDEFTQSGHIPPQLYVREARRMLGARIFTRNDTLHAPGDARGVLHGDAIAVGDYGHSSHGTRHEGSRFGGKRHGEGIGGRNLTPPYQVPYGTIVPKDVRNLLAPVPVSASHVGFCALRLEPIWSSLGQAAGLAAHLAILQGAQPDVRTVSVSQLQQRLHADRSATIYVSDVPPGHPDFAAVQWWGTAGGLHGLAPQPDGALRGKTIQGQHAEAWLNHTADLSRVLDADLARRWHALALELGVKPDRLLKADGRTTRGEWVGAAYKAKD